MKILFVNHFPLTGSGSGVYTANLAKSLVRKGNEVAIIFPENKKNYEQYEEIKLYPVFFKDKEEIQGVEQINMNFPCFTTHPRSLFNFRDMTNEQRKMYEEVFYKKINEVIKEFRPDVIHAQHMWTLAGVTAKCCMENKIPLVVTCHGTDLMGILDEKRRGENWGTNWANIATEYAKAIITISKDSNKQAEEIFPKIKGKTFWIRNGVDSHVFFKNCNIDKQEVLNSFGIEKNYAHVISFVGKLTHFKGVDTLLNAVPKYEDESTITLIVGDGELRKKLEKQAKNLKLKNVEFLGNQPQNKLNEIYNIAECSCVPSRREPFGLVAAEAMLCGTPVVATNEGGLPDFVTEDVGILVAQENSAELAKAIRNIIDNKVVFDSNYIAQKIKSKYSQDVLIDEFIKIYKRM